MELFWDKTVVKLDQTSKEYAYFGKEKHVERTILNNVKGIARPGTFTAIFGPSGKIILNFNKNNFLYFIGSGKTSLLNFLAGRITSPDLKLSGILKINGECIEDINDYTRKIAYVMQDDIVLDTFTPRECFNFAADLKLKIPFKERREKVEKLINDMALKKCADTMVGNELIRYFLLILIFFLIYLCLLFLKRTFRRRKKKNFNWN